MRDDEGMAYWRPQVVRHRAPDGRIEYAIHEVYFAHDGTVATLTVDALSARYATVAALESWLRAALSRADESVTCGDLGYSYDPDALALWLDHIGDPPIEYEDHPSRPGNDPDASRSGV